jgi:hypothetical protein
MPALTISGRNWVSILSVRFQVVMVTNMKMAVVCDVEPSCLVDINDVRK